MNPIESVAVRIRHSSRLARADRLWSVVRPAYDYLLRGAYVRRGVPRLFNGEQMRVVVHCRNLDPNYEAHVWGALLDRVREGDVVADVGAFVGLYSVAFARRVGSGGRVVAFEPDPRNRRRLVRHLSLNEVDECVAVVGKAVGASVGKVAFVAGGIPQAGIAGAVGGNGREVDLTTLDHELGDTRVDVLKVDTEGSELEVLRGAAALLGDPVRRPRTIFVEVHLRELRALGTGAAEVRALLEEYGYVIDEIAVPPEAANRYWLASQ